ncbi:hypothetical protein [Actinoplanes sp. M2I2]|uniref:hypothetical protein n=1 Tax=Actinoplanes sp. M2I2 TaxID=1734444 RepID=UPI0020220EF4|nr:hypothetical protein [Actinoplanes sp. M2I2]
MAIAAVVALMGAIAVDMNRRFVPREVERSGSRTHATVIRVWTVTIGGFLFVGGLLEIFSIDFRTLFS